MYRRHIKMAQMKDIESNKARSEFFHRVASIPVVYLAWNIAAETYNNLKASNKLLNASLTSTERAALFIARPVIKKLEKHLKLADNLACRGLETLQGIVPNIKNQQEKLYRHTKYFYDEKVESGLKKYEVIKHIGTSKILHFIDKGTQSFEEVCASPYGEACDLALDLAFGACEIYVDLLLPPLGDERPEKLFGDRGNEPKWKRGELLKNRFKERLYKHSLLQIQRIRLHSKQFIAKVYRFNLYEYAVEVSSAIPSVTYAAVVYIFSNIEDMISYLFSLFVGQVEDDSMV